MGRALSTGFEHAESRHIVDRAVDPLRGHRSDHGRRRDLDQRPRLTSYFVSVGDTPLAVAFVALGVDPEAGARRWLGWRKASPVTCRARTLDWAFNRLLHAKRCSTRLIGREPEYGSGGL